MKKQGIKGSLTDVYSTYQEALVLVEGSRKRSEYISTVTSLQESLNSVLEAIPPGSREFLKTKKAVIRVSNTITGIRDGLESHDLRLSEVRTLLRELKGGSIAALDSISTVEMSTVEKKSKSTQQIEESESDFTATSRLGDIFKKAERELRARLLEVDASQEGLITEKLEEKLKKSEPLTEDDAKRQQLHTLKTYKESLPRSVGRAGFSFVRSPVLPTFKPINVTQGRSERVQTYILPQQPNPTSLLEKIGMSCLHVEEYTFIYNQLLLLIDRSIIDEKEVKKASKSPKGLQAVPVVEYAKLVLATINENSSHPYSLVSEKPASNPKNPKIAMFWVMPSSALNYLRSKHLPKIENWGLPY